MTTPPSDSTDNALRAAMRRMGLSTREMAETLGISASQVSRMANGKQPLRPWVIRLISFMDHDTPSDPVPATSPEPSP